MRILAILVVLAAIWPNAALASPAKCAAAVPSYVEAETRARQLMILSGEAVLPPIVTDTDQKTQDLIVEARAALRNVNKQAAEFLKRIEDAAYAIKVCAR